MSEASVAVPAAYEPPRNAATTRGLRSQLVRNLATAASASFLGTFASYDRLGLHHPGPGGSRQGPWPDDERRGIRRPVGRDVDGCCAVDRVGSLWARIEPLLPRVRRRFRYPGRKRLPDRQALEGILFVLHTGVAWRHLPPELGFGSGSTCYRRLDEWQRGGDVGATARAPTCRAAGPRRDRG